MRRRRAFVNRLQEEGAAGGLVNVGGYLRESGSEGRGGLTLPGRGGHLTSWCRGRAI